VSSLVSDAFVDERDVRPIRSQSEQDRVGIHVMGMKLHSMPDFRMEKYVLIGIVEARQDDELHLCTSLAMAVAKVLCCAQSQR
jgi:hypothetical protein